MEIEFVEFYVGNALLVSKYFIDCYGFQLVQKPFKNKHRITYELSQNSITFLFTSSFSSEDKEFYSAYQKHGDMSIQDIGFIVENVKETWEKCIKNGAKSISEPQDGFACIQFPQTSWRHSLRTKREKLNVFSTNLFQEIDHLAIAVSYQSLNEVLDYYRNSFGFKDFNSYESLGSQNSGMNVTVLFHSSIKLVFIEPLNGKQKSQIQEFLDYHSGPGVTHAALSTNHMIDTLKTLKTRGIDFIQVPETYYRNWEKRKEYSDIKEDWKQLKELEILIDGHYEDDQFKYLLQTFTLPLGDRPTFYMEVISRREDDGFGRGNINQLYEAIEQLQRERGNL